MAKPADQKDATVQEVATQVASQGISIDPSIIALIAAAVASAVKEAGRDEDKEALKARKEEEREKVRAEELQRLKNIKLRQDACPHIDPYDHYNFVGQRNCKGEIIFVCPQCFRAFQPGDEDYVHYFRYLKHDKLGVARQ